MGFEEKFVFFVWKISVSNFYRFYTSMMLPPIEVSDAPVPIHSSLLKNLVHYCNLRGCIPQCIFGFPTRTEGAQCRSLP